jgi:CBS domain-containing protein
MRIRQLLTEKDNQGKAALITVPRDAALDEVVRLMCQYHMGAVLVLGSEAQLVGIVTERDILRSCCTTELRLDSILVHEIMTDNPVIIHPSDTAEDALYAMTAKNVRHLPVLDEGKLVGIISIGDVLNRLYRSDELKLRYLGDYSGATRGVWVY